MDILILVGVLGVIGYSIVRAVKILLDKKNKKVVKEIPKDLFTEPKSPPAPGSEIIDLFQLS